VETCREPIEVVEYKTGWYRSRGYCISCRWTHDLRVPEEAPTEQPYYTSETGRPSSPPPGIRTRNLTREELQAIHDAAEKHRQRERPVRAKPKQLPPHLRGYD